MFDSQRELLKGLLENRMIDEEELEVVWLIGHKIAEYEKSVDFESWTRHLERNKLIRKIPGTESYELMENGLKIVKSISDAKKQN